MLLNFYLFYHNIFDSHQNISLCSTYRNNVNSSQWLKPSCFSLDKQTISLPVRWTVVSKKEMFINVKLCIYCLEMKNYNSFGISKLKKRKKDTKLILDTCDYIKVIVHLFWKIMDFLFYRISLRSSEDMGKNSMWTMPVTILGVIYSVFSISLESFSESNCCYILLWNKSPSANISKVLFVSKFHIAFNCIH